MSAFLAPIHTWLFNKILLLEDLELNLQNSYVEKYGDEIKDIINSSFSFGNMIDKTKDLEELIELGNIHGWLQNKISCAETRQAYLTTECVNKYGESALEIANKCYIEQGHKSGYEASIKEMPGNAEEIFATLNNYILEGMPCDRVNSILKCEEDIIEWEVSRCIHVAHWVKVQCNVNVFYELRRQWIKSFVEGLNNGYKYEFVTDLEYSGIMGVNRIIKK